MINLVVYDRLYFEKSKIWLEDSEINKLTDTGKLPDDNIRNSWFESLDGRMDYKIWGVEYKGEPIGVCGIKNIKDDIGEYWGYIGEKQYWSKGLGTIMMRLNEEEAQKLGIIKLTLKVLLSNTKAIGLYNKVGYQEYNRDNKYAYYLKTLK